jgi:methylthioribose-1-phosphate isomerase
MRRTVSWSDGKLELIDQRRLPAVLEIASFSRCSEVANAIREMVVRGAPAIGAAAGFGLALAAQESSAATAAELMVDLRRAAATLRAARPTAQNLGWAIERILKAANGFAGTVAQLKEHVIAEAQRLADQDVDTNRRMAKIGASLINDGDTIIHHCNTGALAAVDWGTALGVIRMAHENGKRVRVLVDETRPRLQGARLTAWELEQYGIPYAVITDSMAGHFLSRGEAQKVMFGADRVAANGDVVNKVGTYMLALAAHDNGVPTYAVLPTSTIDLAVANGREIPIEEREPAEVLDIQIRGEHAMPRGATALNPAFDVTPHRLITAIVTEAGIVSPPFNEGLRRMSTA